MFWSTIWDHPDNQALKQQRKDPNALFPGDQIFVPDKEKKYASAASEARHRFRARGVPAKMKVRLLVNEEPRANEKYRLYVDNKLLREGESDADGFIEEFIPPDCTTRKIVIHDAQGNEEHYRFEFGRGDPLDTEEGVKKRLFSLGHDVEDLSRALGKFQQKQGLEETQSINEATREQLKELFGQ